jgi:predicted  nucleic acid-binding Zn-ribbon protein
MKLKCNECGKRFKVSPKNSDPQCPKCGGVDVDVDVDAPEVVQVLRKVVHRNYSTGPHDFGGAFDGNVVSSDADGGL